MSTYGWLWIEQRQADGQWRDIGFKDQENLEFNSKGPARLLSGLQNRNEHPSIPGSGIRPIAEFRGRPQDPKPERKPEDTRHWFGYEDPDHDHYNDYSWFSAQELLDFPWEQELILAVNLSLAQWDGWWYDHPNRASKRPPEEYACSYIDGEEITEAQAIEMLEHWRALPEEERHQGFITEKNQHLIRVATEWRTTYREEFSRLYDELVGWVRELAQQHGAQNLRVIVKVSQ